MKLRNMHRKYYAPADGGGNDLGGNEPPEPKTYTEADIQGLKNKNGEIIGENKQLKQQLADAQALAKQFDGLDVEWLKQLQQKAHEDEESALLAKGQVEEVISKRLALHTANTDKVLAEKDAAILARDEKLARYASAQVKAELAQEAIKSGVLPEAVESVINLHAASFMLSDDGKVIAANGVLGKDGATPLTPAEVFANLRDTQPFFFPRPTGAGAQGNGGANVASNNPFTGDSFNLTEQARLIKQDPVLAKTLANQAGIKI